jgi:hypothetical protein
MEQNKYYANLKDSKLANETRMAFCDHIETEDVIFDKYTPIGFKGTLNKEVGILKKGEYIEYIANNKNIVIITNKNISFKAYFKEPIISDIDKGAHSPRDPKSMQWKLEIVFDILDVCSDNWLVVSPKENVRNMSSKNKYLFKVIEDKIIVYNYAIHKEIDSFHINFPEPIFIQN